MQICNFVYLLIRDAIKNHPNVTSFMIWSGKISNDSMNKCHKIIKKTLYCSEFLCNIVKYRHGNLSILIPILVLNVMRSKQHFTFTRTAIANQFESRNSIYFIATTLLANVVSYSTRKSSKFYYIKTSRKIFVHLRS